MENIELRSRLLGRFCWGSQRFPKNGEWWSQGACWLARSQNSSLTPTTDALFILSRVNSVLDFPFVVTTAPHELQAVCHRRLFTKAHEYRKGPCTFAELPMVTMSESMNHEIAGQPVHGLWWLSSWEYMLIFNGQRLVLGISMGPKTPFLH